MMRRMTVFKWVAFLLLLAVLDPTAAAGAKGDKDKLGQLPEEYQLWLEEVALLITKDERKAFRPQRIP
jgi:hypothetical protein